MNNCNILKIDHHYGAGFFSHCSVRLYKIIEFFNQNGELPESIDGSGLFIKYKNTDEDVSNFFFKKENITGFFEKCKFDFDSQFLEYNKIEFNSINKFVNAYFSPTEMVDSIILDLQNKYRINFNNTCSVFYRGNDKCTETNLAKYEDFFNKVDDILVKFPDIKFLVQTDEVEFLLDFQKRYKNSFFFSEIPLINKNSNMSVHDSLPIEQRKLSAAYFLAATIIVSRTKYLITHSGNCGLWAALYRGNSDNIHQYLNNHSGFIERNGWLS